MNATLHPFGLSVDSAPNLWPTKTPDILSVVPETNTRNGPVKAHRDEPRTQHWTREQHACDLQPFRQHVSSPLSPPTRKSLPKGRKTRRFGCLEAKGATRYCCPHLERSVVCAVCVVKKKIRFAREFHPHRLRSDIVSLRDG